jgi:hypothetical protein
MDHKPIFPIEEDIKLAEGWAHPDNLPPGHKAGEGNGWRHTCYRLAQYIKKQNKIIESHKDVIEQCEATIDHAIKSLRSKQKKQ